MRKRLDFPHGRAYVRRIHADPRNKPPHEGMYPMTRRETAYYWARQELTDGPGYNRLHRYMRRHRDEMGELSIEDDYPAGAYLQLRVTRNLARHRRAIRRLDPPRFRLKLVRHSGRELRRIQASIDFDALEAIGIHPISAGGGADEPIELEVATERTDAQEVVTGMYGPAVKVIVLGPTPTFLDCVVPGRFEVSPDGRTLTVHFGDSGSITPRHLEVVETAYGVDVGVVIETPFTLTADLQHYSLTATLAEPLGSRTVRSIQYGYRVRRGRPTGRG